MVWTDLCVWSDKCGEISIGSKECKVDCLHATFDDGRKRTVPDAFTDRAIPWVRLKSVLFGAFSRLHQREFHHLEYARVVYSTLAPWLWGGCRIKDIQSVLFSGRKSVSKGVRDGCQYAMLMLTAFSADCSSRFPLAWKIWDRPMKGGNQQWTGHENYGGWRGGGKWGGQRNSWGSKPWSQGQNQGQKGKNPIAEMLRDNIEAAQEINKAEALAHFKATIEMSGATPEAREEAIGKMVRQKTNDRMQTMVIESMMGNGKQGNNDAASSMMAMMMLVGANVGGGLGMPGMLGSMLQTPQKPLNPFGGVMGPSPATMMSATASVGPPTRKVRKDSAKDREEWVGTAVMRAKPKQGMIQMTIERCKGGTPEVLGEWINFAVAEFDECNECKEKQAPMLPPTRPVQRALYQEQKPITAREVLDEDLPEKEYHEVLQVISGATEPLNLMPMMMAQFANRPKALKTVRDNVWSASKSAQQERAKAPVAMEIVGSPASVSVVSIAESAPERVAARGQLVQPVGMPKLRPSGKAKAKVVPKVVAKRRAAPVMPQMDVFDEMEEDEFNAPPAVGGQILEEWLIPRVRVLSAVANRGGFAIPSVGILDDKEGMTKYLKRGNLSDPRAVVHIMNQGYGWVALPMNLIKRDLIPNLVDVICRDEFGLTDSMDKELPPIL